MSIYKLNKKYEFAELFAGSEFLELLDNGFEGKSMLNLWEIPKMEWNFQTSSVKCDISMILGLIPIVNKKVKEKLIFIGTANLAEFLPVLVGEQEYYAINVLYHSSELLNKRKSKIIYFSDKTIMHIDKYVFIEEETHPIFKVSQALIHIFVNDIIKDIIERESFTGIEFEKCEISSRRWF
ncbi:imm11 family protein [Winogradskyella ludwigii]|uniref:imm11 family protein n=1 Tax=Winogradskyella ludwigii TaxID=2686076 RepID=UPI0015CE20D8|nr:hypothetical protein [Winogradskyella ludwigii]